MLISAFDKKPLSSVSLYFPFSFIKFATSSTKEQMNGFIDSLSNSVKASTMYASLIESASRENVTLVGISTFDILTEDWVSYKYPISASIPFCHNKISTSFIKLPICISGVNTLFIYNRYSSFVILVDKSESYIASIISPKNLCKYS